MLHNAVMRSASTDETLLTFILDLDGLSVDMSLIVVCDCKTEMKFFL